MNRLKKAFTLVELIVVITILAILGTIAFISLQGYSKSSRDSVRISDVSSIKTALELFHLDAGKYPLPDNNEEITYGTDVLRYQGTAGKTVLSQLSRSLNKIPTDPLNDKEYVFSVSGNKNEFQVLNLLEGDLAYNANQPHPSPLLRGEGIEGILQVNAANTVRTPRVDGQFNGLFVKTANYIVPTPSIITSESIIGLGLLLDSTNIKSQVITGGKNIPVIGSVISKTGALDLVLSVYNGTINKESTDAQKINAMKAIQLAYSGSELAGLDSFKAILDKTTDADLISIADTVILEKTSSTVQVNRLCGETMSGDTKDFWDTDGVDAGQSCENHKKTFTCENTIWKDGSNIADTTTYSNESCSVAADITAPTGGIFTINNNDSITTTPSVTLNITCPTDFAGSNPVEMYISGTGLASGGNLWEECNESKNIILTGGDGTKNITIKFRDSALNETIIVSKSIVFSSSLYTFTTHTFTNCGQTGYTGPSLSQCTLLYNTIWDSNTAYFNMNTNGIQEWTVPTNGTYRIEVAGARGGNGTKLYGKGAIMIANVNLTSGNILKILVGQIGAEGGNSGGGGGGSFVALNNNTALVVAGGGGGGSSSTFGIDASTLTSGTYSNGYASSSNKGRYGGPGTNGGGGGGSICGGSGGGGGFLGNGGACSSGQYCTTGGGAGGDGLAGGNGICGTLRVGTEGKSFINGGMGGTGNATIRNGGFGGGSAIYVRNYGGGAGGGYSGGGGSTYSGSGFEGGAGGGSYIIGTATTVSTTVGNTGQGYVIITKL